MGFLWACLAEEGAGTEGAANLFHSQFQFAKLAKHTQAHVALPSLADAKFSQSGVCGGPASSKCFIFPTAQIVVSIFLVIKWF